ncbi:dnaJ-like protein 60 isoform X2 [Atheta coriaria]|uniref:dnaJ-like protein 60 isoform X2 n=1 Tax=Dalotia coriaria TaxID=877792 RepID=UPI0031F3AC9A
MMNCAVIFKNALRFGLSNFKLRKSLQSKAKQNYYEILNLNQNCSSRDIKRAYIDLSKKYHPDKNGHVDSQMFLDVSEAYSVLSKKDLRRDYDLVMFPRRKMKRDMYYNQGINEIKFKRNPMDDPSFFRNRDKSKDKFYESKPYYGIKGLPRMSNSVILVAVLLIMAVGMTAQVLAIQYSVTFRRDELMYQSNMANRSLEKARQTAEQNGNQMQLAILEEKFRSLE